MRKKKPTNVIPQVPQDKNSKKSPGSPGKSSPPMSEKKNALRPNAARGKAVAVPRWCGQFKADVLTEAAKAMHPPSPERYEKKHSKGTEPTAWT